MYNHARWDQSCRENKRGREKRRKREVCLNDKKGPKSDAGVCLKAKFIRKHFSTDERMRLCTSRRQLLTCVEHQAVDMYTTTCTLAHKHVCTCICILTYMMPKKLLKLSIVSCPRHNSAISAAYITHVCSCVNVYRLHDIHRQHAKTNSSICKNHATPLRCRCNSRSQQLPLCKSTVLKHKQSACWHTQ